MFVDQFFFGDGKNFILFSNCFIFILFLESVFFFIYSKKSKTKKGNLKSPPLFLSKKNIKQKKISIFHLNTKHLNRLNIFS